MKNKNRNQKSIKKFVSTAMLGGIVVSNLPIHVFGETFLTESERPRVTENCERFINQQPERIVQLGQPEQQQPALQQIVQQQPVLQQIVQQQPVLQQPVLYTDNHIVYKLFPRQGVAWIIRVDDEFNETDLVIRDTIDIDGTNYRIERIGKEAFYECRDLESVTIGNNVKEIGEGAFEDCDSLKNVVIGNNVEKIDEDAFNGCYELESVVIGDNVREIGSRAFIFCDKLKELTINARIIGDGAFIECRSLKNLTIGNKIETIGCGAFERCTNLRHVKILSDPDERSWKKIIVSKDAFKACPNLEKIEIPIINRFEVFSENDEYIRNFERLLATYENIEAELMLRRLETGRYIVAFKMARPCGCLEGHCTCGDNQ